MRKLSLLVALLLFTGLVAAGPEFEIRENSCNDDEENLFSMYDRKGGNVGEPGYYKWQVCGQGIIESTISEGCGDEQHMISMKTKKDSHASIYSEYRYDVCTESLSFQLNETCANPVASMHSKTDSHVAEPGYYKYQICPQIGEAENITVTVKTDASEVYVDSNTAQEKVYSPLELAFPYISTDQPLGIVSYGDLVNIEYSTQNSNDILSVTQSSGSFLVPFTSGGYPEIEDQQEEVVQRRFLNLNLPSFSFYMPEERSIQVRKQFDRPVEGFGNDLEGYIDLAVRNRLGNSTGLLVSPR